MLFISAFSEARSQFTLKPFSVNSSPLTIELKTLKASKPNMSPDEFVIAANELLDKDGVGFTFYFDTATCDKIDKAFASKKPGGPPPVLKATLSSVGGEKAGLLLPPPDPMSCVPCSVTLPVLQVTSSDFITKISDRNIKFVMPPEFTTDQVQLLDATDVTKVKQTWRIPFKAQPLSVLYDENAIYLGFPERELSELSLLVFDDGTFQFATRREAETIAKGVAFDSSKMNDQSHSYMLFQNREKKQLVRFPKSCK
jgi:hypothetical protein